MPLRILNPPKRAAFETEPKRKPIPFKDYIPKEYSTRIIPGRFSSKEDVEHFIKEHFDMEGAQIDQISINKFGAMVVWHPTSRLAREEEPSAYSFYAMIRDGKEVRHLGSKESDFVQYLRDVRENGWSFERVFSPGRYAVTYADKDYKTLSKHELTEPEFRRLWEEAGKPIIVPPGGQIAFGRVWPPAQKSGPLDTFFGSGPEAPKEPSPLTHLKVGDRVENDIMDHSKLGDYSKVVKVDGNLITVQGEGISPPEYVRDFVPAGATKTFDETHFLEVGFGIHYGEREDYYVFYFVFTPPQDILAFGLRPAPIPGEEHARPFHYWAPVKEFNDKLPAFVQKLKEHHYWQPHGPYFWEVMRGEDRYGRNQLPRKAYELQRAPRGVPRASLFPMQPATIHRPGLTGSIPWYDERGYCARCAKMFVIPEERREKKAFCPECGKELRRKPREAALRPKYAREDEPIQIRNPEPRFESGIEIGEEWVARAGEREAGVLLTRKRGDGYEVAVQVNPEFRMRGVGSDLVVRMAEDLKKRFHPEELTLYLAFSTHGKWKKKVFDLLSEFHTVEESLDEPLTQNKAMAAIWGPTVVAKETETIEDIKR